MQVDRNALCTNALSPISSGAVRCPNYLLLAQLRTPNSGLAWLTPKRLAPRVPHSRVGSVFLVAKFGGVFKSFPSLIPRIVRNTSGIQAEAMFHIPSRLVRVLYSTCYACVKSKRGAIGLPTITLGQCSQAASLHSAGSQHEQAHMHIVGQRSMWTLA